MNSDVLCFAIIFGMFVGIACCAVGSFIANIILKTTDLYKEKQKTLKMMKIVNDAIEKDK